MAYTPARTWVANEIVSASMLNTHVRDNMNETAVAKVTTAGDIVYATGPNTLARLARGAIAGGVANEYVIHKTADETVTSSTVHQNDDHLVLALAANEIWLVELFAFAVCAAASVDFKFQWTIPVGASGGQSAVYEAPGGADTFVSGVVLTGSLSVDLVAARETPIHVRVYVANAATPGNLTLQWAQVASSASGVTLKQGSFLRCIKAN